MRRAGLLACSVVALWLLEACALRPPTLPAGEPLRARTVLVDATVGQDRTYAAAFQEVERWIGQKAFPGAVVAVGQRGKLVALKPFGRMDYSSHADPVPRDAVFDLASLTKVIATTTAAAILYDRKQLDLDAPVVRYLPEFAGVSGHENVLVRHLLTHSSGLNSRQVLWKQAGDRQGILKLAFALPLEWAPGERTQYRDYNMIVMGEIINRITGQRLDEFVARNAFEPLGMQDTRYNPPAEWLSRIPPTEQDDVLRHRMVHGVVHDENAFLMDGVSGHAGLFSSARDLARFAQMYLNGGVYDGKRILSEATVRRFTARQVFPIGTTRALGWDTPGEGSFPGPLAVPSAIIHTGFTGTSIYIDRSRQSFIVLLTNRVHPTRQNLRINQARPAIHTAILSILDHT